MQISKQANYTYDAIILGAGASGLMCALTAANRKLRIAIIDHNSHAGRKISISGGGKCNFTNLNMGSTHYIGEQSFVEPALDAFTPQKTLDLFRKYNLSWEEREHGQLFGTQSAKQFVRALVQDCLKLGCHFFLEHKIENLKKEENIYYINCHSEQKKLQLKAKNLVLALGSSAWSNIGASDTGLKLADRFGHSYSPFSSALCAFHMPKHWNLAELSGISLIANIKTANYSCTDHLLFTHNGFSGPAALQASGHWQKNNPIFIDFLPNTPLSDLLDARECAKLFSRTLICRHMPQRLADKLIPHDYARRKIAELSRKARNEICNNIHSYSTIPQNIADLSRAEAAKGGVNTTEVDPWSMASKKENNLYIIGELLDIAGQLGGYNLHFAFASGYLAGLNI